MDCADSLCRSVDKRVSLVETLDYIDIAQNNINSFDMPVDIRRESPSRALHRIHVPRMLAITVTVSSFTSSFSCDPYPSSFVLQLRLFNAPYFAIRAPMTARVPAIRFYFSLHRIKQTTRHNLYDAISRFRGMMGFATWLRGSN